MKLIQEFKQFLLRGNVVDLAVGVVIGSAFGAVVSAFVTDLLTPLIAAISGHEDFGKLSFTVNNSTFSYGHFINALISFIMVAGVVFFIVLKPMNAMITRTRIEPATPEPTTQACPECLSAVPINARRCKFCASPLETA